VPDKFPGLIEVSMIKKILDVLIDHPVITSILVADFFILLLHKPPVFFSVIMLGALMAICMYLGQKSAIFK
jgi:hypothetical protein